MKRLIALFCGIIVIFLSSCQNDKKSIKIVSCDFPETPTIYARPLNSITEEKLDSIYEEYKFSDVTKYCVSKQIGGGLRVESSRGNTDIKVCYGGGGYYIGMNYFDFATGIIYRTAAGYKDTDTKHIMDGRCIAFLEPNDADFEYCYAVTGYDYFCSEEALSLYKLTFLPEQSAEKIIDIPNYITAYDAVITDDNQIFILTSDSLLLIDNDTYAVSTVEMPIYWEKLFFTSMVYIDNALFIGTYYGILQYEIASGTFFWYPMNENFT